MFQLPHIHSLDLNSRNSQNDSLLTLKIKTKKERRMLNNFNLNIRTVAIKVKYGSVSLKHLLLKQVILQSLQIRLFT
tara:strand:- start:1380 stop:1610 length:231 start_codon:yes stop_codon:yes gene_type:complete